MITGFYAAILALLYIGLTFNVIRKRYQFGVGLGTGNQIDLDKAVRMHGNFAEHVPFALILMLLTEYVIGAEWIIHALGILLIISRPMHAIGIHRSSGKTLYRAIGVIGTNLVMLITAMILIFHFIFNQY
jgi:uncharacterized membrane protein YecN with MAPEG domain